MYDIIIIGGGIAGLTSALYASRAGKSVLVLEEASYGGAIINTLDIANYPGISHISGYELATNLYEQVKELKVSIVNEKALKIKNMRNKKQVITKNNVYEGKAIILATGRNNRKLGLLHEDELIGKGLSYCATCDGAFYRGKVVSVVGGGNTALEDALYLSTIAKEVYLIHRRDTFRGDDITINLLKKKDNVHFIFNSTISKFKITDHRLSGIVIKNSQEETILVDALFVAIGREPKNEIVKNLVKLDDNGYIIINQKCHTNIKGIFAAGDNCRKSLYQLVTATSDGAIAAEEAVLYLNKKKG